MLLNIKKLVNFRQDFHLYIIGDGSERKKLEKMVTDLNISEYVTFLGSKKNPFKFLKQMDLFYLSSRYEGQGMVLLEALAVGLDVLLPKHLEKYCPYVKGEKDPVNYLKKYKKKGQKTFNDLHEYNNEITAKLEQLFE